ncbi:MAG: hypothetical protein WCP36_08345, partial [Methanomicrobiales archaeon]
HHPTLIHPNLLRRIFFQGLLLSPFVHIPTLSTSTVGCPIGIAAPAGIMDVKICESSDLPRTYLDRGECTTSIISNDHFIKETWRVESG